KHLVYVMKVSEAMTFEEYWSEPRFQRKKPNLRGSKKQAFGDNIYSIDSKANLWCQLNSHHSMPDGTPNQLNVNTDTATNRVLISDDFVYWGGSGPLIPNKFLNFGAQHLTLRIIRNHRTISSPEFLEEFSTWIRALNQSGFVGEP